MLDRVAVQVGKNNRKQKVGKKSRQPSLTLVINSVERLYITGTELKENVQCFI